MATRDFNFIKDLQLNNFSIDTNYNSSYYTNLEAQLRVIIYSLFIYEKGFFDSYLGKRITNKNDFESKIEKDIINHLISKYPLEEKVKMISVTAFMVKNNLNLFFYYYNVEKQKNVLIFDTQIIF